MKKLSEKQKRYWVEYAKRSFCNRVKRKYKYITLKAITERTQNRVLVAPTNMNLQENYEETATFFNKLRKLCTDRTSPFKIDFTKIQNISPAAALIFTAEIDRIKKTRLFKKFNLSVLDFESWNENVKLQLRDMGMFEILDVKNVPQNFNNIENKTDEIFLKFQSGYMASGEDVTKLKKLISELTYFPEGQQLQAGLTEAMTNSIHHAYPIEYLQNNMIKEKLWWMSASINLRNKILTVMFYDEGVGIPKTLPKTWPELFKSIAGFTGDAEIIQAATRTKRTSTKKTNRGRGLLDIKNYTHIP
ncbi:MAG: hypothetical protein AB7U85_02625 [Alphaproteobacteria bacterium]